MNCIKFIVKNPTPYAHLYARTHLGQFRDSSEVSLFINRLKFYRRGNNQ